jgi:primosomal protein N' (replication factor Y)
MFAPLNNPGLVIIDEEHEPSYKQEEIQGRTGTPLYHAREVALEMARLSGAKVILGSATPSVESYFRAQSGEFELLELPERVAAPLSGRNDGVPAGYIPLPPIQIVDLRQELKAGNSSIFSRELRQQLKITLEKKQQAILFLNRRGTATVVMCRDCGYVEQCHDCETPLVWHADLEHLICHRCGRHYPHPQKCATCGSPRIRYFGTGTKRVEEEVLKLFPEARVLRWDQDTILEGGRDSYQRFYDKMARHEADILVGTQMIAKGLDLPMVSLVGVVTSDTGLYLPDFRATERTFQILTQVAGRAGRRAGSEGVARAILQTYTPDQYAIQAASRHNYNEFFKNDLEFRVQRLYPPYSKLVKFVYAYPKEQRAKLEIERIADELKLRFEEAGILPESWSMIGPAPAFQRKIKGLYRYQFVLRLHRLENLPQDENEQLMRRIIGSLRPQLLHGWTVDVDPQSLL